MASPAERRARPPRRRAPARASAGRADRELVPLRAATQRLEELAGDAPAGVAARAGRRALAAPARRPHARRWPATASRLDLPMPAGPSTTITRPAPARTAASCRPSAAISTSRSSSSSHRRTDRTPRPAHQRQKARVGPERFVVGPRFASAASGEHRDRCSDRRQETPMSTTEAQRTHRRDYALGRTPAGIRAAADAGARLGGCDRPPAGPGRARAGRELPGRRLRTGRDDAPDGPPGRADGPRRSASMSTRRSAPSRRRCCTTRVTGSAASTRTTSPPTSRSRAPRSTSSTPACCCSTCPERVAVLPRLWDAVAPGGHLVVQDYDLRTVGVLPTLRQRRRGRARVDRRVRPRRAATCRSAPGCRTCSRRPASALRTAPTSPAASSRSRPAARCSSTRSAACCRPRSLTASPPSRAPPRRWRARRDADRFADRPLLWPLLIGAWKHKDQA